MNTNKTEEVLKEALTPEAKTEVKVETKAEVETEAKVEAEQDPLKIELERVQRTGKTEKEKAEFSLKKNAERVKALGGDPNSILGIEKEEDTDEDDDKPITVGMYKKLQRDNASKTALQQAEEIQNETERELVKYHLQNTIKSTGLPNEDLKLARSLVNAVKNTKIIEEQARKPIAKTHSNSSGVDAKQAVADTSELTKAEMIFMSAPFRMTKEQIIKARKK